MSWRHGLIRVWIIISLIYGAVWLGYEGSEVVFNVKTLAAPEKVETNLTFPEGRVSFGKGIDILRRREARQALQNLAVGGVVLPALFWVLLYAGFWAARGFKGKQ